MRSDLVGLTCEKSALPSHRCPGFARAGQTAEPRDGKFEGITECSFLSRLTVFLAAFRYVFLSCKTLSVYVSSPDRALIGVSAVVILSTTLCIPSYVGHRIVKVYQNDTSSTPGTVKEIVYYRFEETAFSKSLALRETVFVLHSVMFKLIPCLLLLLFSFLLVQQLRFALRQSEKLHRHTSSSVGGSTSNGRIRGRRRENENRRTTLMLVSVCVLFLVTELPQGAILLLAFLSKSKSSHYFQIYQHLGRTSFITSRCAIHRGACFSLASV